MLDTKRLLDQFLGTGSSGGGLAPRSGRENDLAGLLQGALGGRGLEGMMRGGLGGALGGAGGGGLGGALGGGLGKGAIAAGLAGLLLKGGRKPKKMVGSAVKMGGLALVAGLAYRAYQDYQQSQAGAPRAAAPASAAIAPPSDPAFLPQTAPAEQDRARVILRAMIAAAKADGHVDAEEQTKLFDAVDMLDLDSDDKAFMMDELRAPLDVAAVVRDVEGVEAASEVYLASRIVIAEPDAAEVAYLRDLAGRLALPQALVAQLDAQVDAMEA